MGIGESGFLERPAMTQQAKVRDRLQQQYKLKVLRIYLDNSMDDKSIAIFTLTLGNGEEVAVLTASMPELGLPDTADFDVEGEADLQDSVFRIPDHILGALKSLLTDSEPADAPLWIRLSVPLGLLPAVPWERLLQPYLGIPILRLPHHRLCPRVPTSDIDTVLCFSSPAYEPDLQRRLDLFIEQIPVDLAKATNFHLFANRTVYPKLLELKTKYDSHFSITVYQPRDDVSHTMSGTQNPWLCWMRSALGERSADVVHFLCHGYRVREEGALAFASSPNLQTKSTQASIVFAPELVEFLNQVGAWCVAFTSSSTDDSVAGIRMLQNTVARLRPGPAIVHEMKDPDSRRALGAAYRFLFTPPQPPPASSAISLYCHPIWVSGEEMDEDSNQQLQEFTLDGMIADRVAGSSPPTWLASSQRKLEASAEDLAEAEETDPDNGRTRARKLVLDAITEHAQKSFPEKPGKKDGSPL
jgi:hypothetical protein